MTDKTEIERIAAGGSIWATNIPLLVVAIAACILDGNLVGGAIGAFLLILALRAHLTNRSASDIRKPTDFATDDNRLSNRGNGDA